MKRKAVALLSGGLDSTLAICVLQEQGIEVEAVNFQTMFGCCKDDARSVAHQLGVRLSILKVGDDYLKVIEKPKYGYGRGMNPCVDCRSYMFHLAKKFMQEVGASFVISGEVLGQRPMSQKKRDFEIIEKEAGLEGLVVRPLSGKLLPVTVPEKMGWIEREKMYAIQGRSRMLLTQLAAKYGIENPPQPSNGCALTERKFAKKVKDVFDFHPDYQRWEFEILKVGRHFRLDDQCKVIVGRNHEQNTYLEMLHPEGTRILKCHNFAGPTALLIGELNQERLEKSSKLMQRYCQKSSLPAICEIEVVSKQGSEIFKVLAAVDETMVEEVRIV